MAYMQPIPPSQYFIRKSESLCISCSIKFIILSSYDNTIVKYVEPTSGEERWLPLYGDGGYLDLMHRLVPEFDSSQEITMLISKSFERIFSPLQEPSNAGYPFVLFIRPSCPQCGSTDLRIVSEKVLDTPRVNWMKYSGVFTSPKNSE